MKFKDIKDMNDKELAKWLEKIWKTGFYTCKAGGTVGDMPNFYERLSEE